MTGNTNISLYGLLSHPTVFHLCARHLVICSYHLAKDTLASVKIESAEVPKTKSGISAVAQPKQALSMPGPTQPASAPILTNRLLYCLDQEDVDKIQPACVGISEIVEEALVRQGKDLLDTISLEIYYETLSEWHMLTDRIRESLWVWTPFSGIVKRSCDGEVRSLTRRRITQPGPAAHRSSSITGATSSSIHSSLRAVNMSPCNQATDDVTSEADHLSIADSKRLKRPQPEVIVLEDSSQDEDRNEGKLPPPAKPDLTDDDDESTASSSSLEDKSEVASSLSKRIDEEDDAFNEAKEDEPRRVPAKFKIKGMNKSPYAYQFLAAMIMLKMRNSITGGGILADEPGFGKINEDRGKGRTDRHLAANKQEEDAQCPSQARWPILCACVESGPISQFGSQQGLNLIIVPAKFISNWRNEYKYIYDRKSHKLLDLRCFICHGDLSYSSDHPNRQDLTPFRVKEGTTAPWEHQRCIFITTPGTFYGHVASVINTEKYEWRVSQNRKRPQRHTITEKNLTAGYVVADEYHESKGSTTQLFTIIKQIKKRNPAATITSVSGTPWSRSPKDLVGIFEAMSTGREAVWANDPVLRYAIGHNINEIVRAFENSTKVAGELVMGDKLRKHINHLTEILEACVVCRVTESLWGKYPIVPLPPKNVTFVDTADEFPTDLRKLLAVMEGKLAAETTAAAKSEAAKKNIYFKKAWQVRAVATLPSLLRLQKGQYIKEEFHKNPGNPYVKAAEMLCQDAPKVFFVKDIINGLGTMKYKCGNDDEAKMVPEKLVIMGNNPVVMRVITTYLKKVYKGQPRRRFRFVSSSMVASDRQDVVDAFQEKSGSDPDLD
ncbi:MAG: hypothetical protein Q9212_004663 [Teloschistes hypoglaucus]